MLCSQQINQIISSVFSFDSQAFISGTLAITSSSVWHGVQPTDPVTSQCCVPQWCVVVGFGDSNRPALTDKIFSPIFILVCYSKKKKGITNKPLQLFFLLPGLQNSNYVPYLQIVMI